MTEQPMGAKTDTTVAVIGGGISGLSAARALTDSGLRVQVYDRGRRIGGRMSSRRTDDGACFDFGAPCFAVTRAAFAREVELWRKRGVVHPWYGSTATVTRRKISPTALLPRLGKLGYVGVPSMSAVAVQTAADIGVHTGSEVFNAHRADDRWQLFGKENQHLGEADVLVVAMPGEQAKRLLHRFPRPMAQIKPVESCARWVVMVSFSETIAPSVDRVVFQEHESLQAAWHESRKPGRSGRHWVVHARDDWSAARLAAESATIGADLSAACNRALGVTGDPITVRAHRWRFSQPPSSLDIDCIWDDTLQLAACGDWCCGGGVQGAFLSGAAATKRILATHGTRRSVCVQS